MLNEIRLKIFNLRFLLKIALESFQTLDPTQDSHPTRKIVPSPYSAPVIAITVGVSRPTLRVC